MAMAQSLSASKFIADIGQQLIIDVRTPDEYAKGHIPGAVNIPLFSNQERVAVGTTYKKQGQQAAILLGLDYVGPKMRRLLEHLDTFDTDKQISMYCWRGGMRSQSFAWLAELYGYQAVTLRGGYKAFRRQILTNFEQSRRLIVLGGKTGSGKTEILQAIKDLGQTVLDLEALAKHKGSVFGNLEGLCQPTQQQFENQLGLFWQSPDFSEPIWIEDESRQIGEVTIPETVWRQMRSATTLFIDVPLEQRIERLVQEYGQQPPENLAQAIYKIKKRLGGLHTRQALEALQKNQLSTCCTILLEQYYDKAYLFGLSKRTDSEVRHIHLDSPHPRENAAKVIAFSQHYCGLTS
ncbi:MAG: tRNA 2-selenouridine(34) synthase MnmH [Chloroflexota bacterium]